MINEPIRLRFFQSHIPPERLSERLFLSQLYLLLTTAFFDVALPRKIRHVGIDITTLLVLICVFIGDAEGKPATATKIASHCGLPRPTVYRRLEQLLKLKKITRIGRNYFVAPEGASPDDRGRLASIIHKIAVEASKMDRNSH
jgi:hypothetical protein